MIQIRDVFQVKFGKIDQAVTLFARLSKMSPAYTTADTHYHVLTDISGPMYSLVTELMLPSLGEWEAGRDKLFSQTEFADWFREFQLLIEAGRREYYTIEGHCDEWSRPGVIVVRQVFRALKWQIRPTVSLLQRYGAMLADSGVGRRPRILTDASGPMFQAVIEIEVDGLSEWEGQRRGLFKQPEFQVWFLQLCSQVEAGSHEFLRVEVAVSS
ncbi:MAG: hypothetical protein HY023_09770 [Chloroflexi bacterium]|nr:hypothetical protein [Chloroflexota bacterium]